MAGKVQFDLVSPERLLRSEEVDMVVVPGTEGDFGVLPGHAPVISTIRPGLIEVHDAGAETERIYVAGGICEVSADRCTVLAEEAIRIADLDRASVEQRLKNAQEDLEDAATDEASHKAADAVALLTDLLHALR